MIYWPVISAIIGISTIFFFLFFLSVLTFYKLIFNFNETTEEITEELLKETYKDEDYKNDYKEGYEDEYKYDDYSPDTTNPLNNLD